MKVGTYRFYLGLQRFNRLFVTVGKKLVTNAAAVVNFDLVT